jgi:hypothetical protein
MYVVVVVETAHPHFRNLMIDHDCFAFQFVDLAGTQGYANVDQSQRKRAREINRNILSFGKLVQEIGKKQKEVLKRTGKDVQMTALRECK